VSVKSGQLQLQLQIDKIYKIEKPKASVRAKMEHPFRVIKMQFGHVKVRYRGLAKNTAQLHTLFVLSNLWISCHRILQVTQV
jgi:transposase, IS5 family